MIVEKERDDKVSELSLTVLSESEIEKIHAKTLVLLKNSNLLISKDLCKIEISFIIAILL